MSVYLPSGDRMTEVKDLVPLPLVAARLRRKYMHLWNDVTSGRLEVERLGGRYFVRESVVQELERRSGPRA